MPKVTSTVTAGYGYFLWKFERQTYLEVEEEEKKLNINIFKFVSLLKVFWRKCRRKVTGDSYLILIGMRGDTFISLSFLDQIFSAEFLSKISNFWDVKADIF